MTIKRYDPCLIGMAENKAGMCVHPEGEFVKHDDHLAALRREREPVKVKPLVWLPAPSICTREKAEALGGHYSVVEFDAGTDEHHFAANIDLGGLAFVFILEPDPFGGRRPKRYPTLEAAKAAAQADYEARILAALEPDQTALALVAAAYRDAGEAFTRPEAKHAIAEHIAKRTPADATAALAAIERAAYERGVRDALTEAIKEAKGSVTIGGQRFLTTKLDDLEPALLALITQEGR